MGFSELNNLQNRLATLNGNLSSYNTQLSTQKKRREKLESLIRDMRSVVSNDYEAINSHMTKVINAIEPALKGVANAEIMYSVASSDKEKDINSDNDMNEALSQLESELRDVNSKIDSLEQNIRNTASQINTCNNSIAGEKRNIAQGYRNQYNSAEVKFRAAERAYRQDPTNTQLLRKYNNAKWTWNQARNEFNKYRSWL
ncbi:MAG: hypothetical protein ACI4HO_00295 [Ruminococcus sp.]